MEAIVIDVAFCLCKQLAEWHTIYKCILVIPTALIIKSQIAIWQIWLLSVWLLQIYVFVNYNLHQKYANRYRNGVLKGNVTNSMVPASRLMESMFSHSAYVIKQQTR